MRTTLDLPDELLQRLQRRAQHDGRTPEQVAADLLAAGLPPEAAPAQSVAIVPKHLPLIKARPAEPADAKKLTTQEFCHWLKDLDLQMEVERYEKAFGHQYVDRVNG